MRHAPARSNDCRVIEAIVGVVERAFVFPGVGARFRNDGEFGSGDLTSVSATGTPLNYIKNLET